jgi:undecaprenyl diphosphate synthase
MNEVLTDNINPSDLPQHVAIIMDGNGRWAKRQGQNRTFGHQNAVEAVRSAIRGCDKLHIPYLTLFAFSSENWNRPKMEVKFLMNLLANTIKAEIEEFHRNKVRLNIIGEPELIPKRVLRILNDAVELTKNNTGLTCCIALSYGSKNEIIQAVKNISDDVKSKKLNSSDIDENLFEKYLYTKNFPPVDLLIRTSGEYRISNFLLWQIAYAELYFTDQLWPDFREIDLYKAVKNYAQRERRYGKTGEQIKV